MASRPNISTFGSSYPGGSSAEIRLEEPVDLATAVRDTNPLVDLYTKLAENPDDHDTADYITEQQLTELDQQLREILQEIQSNALNEVFHPKQIENIVTVLRDKFTARRLVEAQQINHALLLDSAARYILDNKNTLGKVKSYDVKKALGVFNAYHEGNKAENIRIAIDTGAMDDLLKIQPDGKADPAGRWNELLTNSKELSDQFEQVYQGYDELARNLQRDISKDAQALLNYSDKVDSANQAIRDMSTGRNFGPSAGQPAANAATTAAFTGSSSGKLPERRGYESQNTRRFGAIYTQHDFLNQPLLKDVLANSQRHRDTRNELVPNNEVQRVDANFNHLIHALRPERARATDLTKAFKAAWKKVEARDATTTTITEAEARERAGNELTPDEATVKREGRDRVNRKETITQAEAEARIRSTPDRYQDEIDAAARLLIIDDAKANISAVDRMDRAAAHLVTARAAPNDAEARIQLNADLDLLNNTFHDAFMATYVNPSEAEVTTQLQNPGLNDRATARAAVDLVAGNDMIITIPEAETRVRADYAQRITARTQELINNQTPINRTESLKRIKKTFIDDIIKKKVSTYTGDNFATLDPAIQNEVQKIRKEILEGVFSFTGSQETELLAIDLLAEIYRLAHTGSDFFQHLQKEFESKFPNEATRLGQREEEVYAEQETFYNQLQSFVTAKEPVPGLFDNLTATLTRQRISTDRYTEIATNTSNEIHLMTNELNKDYANRLQQHLNAWQNSLVDAISRGSHNAWPQLPISQLLAASIVTLLGVGLGVGEGIASTKATT